MSTRKLTDVTSQLERIRRAGDFSRKLFSSAEHRPWVGIAAMKRLGIVMYADASEPAPAAADRTVSAAGD